jgi:flavodoxin
MKAVIIYDSVYGNTEKIAHAMKDALAAHEVHMIKVGDADIEKVKGADLLIVGSPTHGGRPTPAMKDFLQKIPKNALQGMCAAAFDTGIPKAGQGAFLQSIINVLGYAAKHIATALKKKGATILKAETFYVAGKEGPLKNGELDRVQSWVKVFLQGL